MTTGSSPRLMLVTPPLASADGFAATLEEAISAGDIAAVLLRLAGDDERAQINTAKAIAKVVQQHETALILDNSAELAARSGADGAHLTGSDIFQSEAPSLKPDRIAGAGGLESRHDAMMVAEANADYVMFGEPDANGERPSFDAVVERVEWWAEVFQTPCVAYAAMADEIGPLVKAGADFIALDPALWTKNPRAAVMDAMTRLQQPEPVS